LLRVSSRGGARKCFIRERRGVRRCRRLVMGGKAEAAVSRSCFPSFVFFFPTLLDPLVSTLFRLRFRRFCWPMHRYVFRPSHTSLRARKVHFSSFPLLSSRNDRLQTRLQRPCIPPLTHLRLFTPLSPAKVYNQRPHLLCLRLNNLLLPLPLLSVLQLRVQSLDLRRGLEGPGEGVAGGGGGEEGRKG
jgi:hypothetical protein